MSETKQYLAFATLITGKGAMNVATVEEVRGGVQFDGVLLELPEMATRFSDAMGLQRANDITLKISDGPTGIYREAVLDDDMEGIVVTLELVMRSIPATGGAPTEITVTQTLSVVGTGLSPGEVRLRLVDLEEKKLAELYPPQLWKATDWPDVSDRDAGRTIGYPVGTALKLPAVQIRLDATNIEWWFGACAGTAKTYTITSISSGSKRFFTAADLTGILRVGQVVIVTGTAATDNRFTVTAVTSTYFNVSEPVTLSGGGGLVRIMPDPLTVYRSGRVVNATEYLVHHCFTPGVIANGEFAAGGTAWTTWYWTTVGGFVNTPGGAASIVFGVSGAVITSPSATDYAFIQQYGAIAGTFNGIKGARYAVQVTVGAGGADAVVTDNGPPIMTHRCPAGETTTIILSCGVTGNAMSVGVGVWNNVGVTTIKSVRFVELSGALLLFASEQLDFRGNPYVIESDFLSAESRNVATEIQRLLQHVGLTADAATFATATSAATAAQMLVDCDYGRAGQRRVSAILDDLLLVARAGLSRTAAGAYSIWQDVVGSSILSLDESLGDSLVVADVSREGRPSSVAIKYRPGSRDPSDLQNTIVRSIAGGVLGDESPRAVPYLRDHLAADHLLSYTAARRTVNRIAHATVYGQQLTLGAVITLTSPQNWVGPLAWKVRAIQRIPGGNEVELIEYDAAVYTYVASPALSRNAKDTYAPDYSNTPPAAPTALTILSATTGLSKDGNAGTRISVQATVPAANWATIWFAVIHNVTGEILRQQGSVTGATATANFGGLRAGEVYQLKCYAINIFAIQGVVQGTFNATAIGGGGADTTFTTPGVTVLPPTVPSIDRNQGTGKLVNVSWGAVTLTEDNLAEYILEANPGSGFVEIWRGRALSYVDRSVSYGVTYTYRVRARDRWGNVSAGWRTGFGILVARNVTGGSSGDIMDTTVETTNRIALSFHLINVSHAGGAFMATATQAHGMIKEPIAGVIGGNSTADYLSTVDAIDATNITVRSRYFGTGVTTSDAPANPHTHAFVKPGLGVIISVRIEYW